MTAVRERLDSLRGLSLDRTEVLAASVFFMLAAIQRGLDYLAFPGQETVGLSSVERSFSLSWWGAIFVGLGLAGLLGIALKRWEVVSIAHFALGGMYLVFAIAYAVDSDVTNGGWRTSGDWAAIFVPLHWILSGAATRAWRRRRAGE